MSHETDLQNARAVADAVMYEGYLLYPYRASAAKNRVRWQFGVLGPQGAAAAGVGEAPDLSAQILVRHNGATTVTVRLRFLQLNSRSVESFDAAAGFVSVDELRIDDQQWLAWDEAIEHELLVGTVPVDGTTMDTSFPISVEGATEEVSELRDRDGRLAGRATRSRRPLNAMVHLTARPTAEVPSVSCLGVEVRNRGTLSDPVAHEALAGSFLGAHLLLSCTGGELVSMQDPPAELEAAAQDCRQNRCWPVLAGPEGSSDVLLVSPIILGDHPQLAPESAGALFDSTEIDEILTLRILTMTEQEKSQARATDPRAAEIIDRSESLSQAELSRMHGALRNPHALAGAIPAWDTTVDATTSGEPPADAIPTWETLPEGGSAVPWWDPERDASVDPGTDTVMIGGQRVGRGALVSLHPNRRADAQDIFFSGQKARVTGVHFDVDGATHVGVVLIDDPAADVHEWYGRFLYFAPDEIRPIEPGEPGAPGEVGEAAQTQIPTVPRKES
jgi:hypothetical protein